MSTHQAARVRFSRMGPGVGLVAALAAVTSACGAGTAQVARSPADQAAFMERTRCSADDDEKTLAPVLNGATLLSVHPRHSATFGSSGKGDGARLRGVVLTVGAAAGVTDVWLDRALECHSAKAALGHIATGADDPFYLPGSTVDIDVRSAKDGFDIIVSGYSQDDATQVFARAEAFAKARNASALKGADAPH
jgi:hypothetical protein